MQRKRNNSGFTLFEITFVIVFICLLVTTLAIGQNLTINSKVNRLKQDLISLQTAMYDAQLSSGQIQSNIHKASSPPPDSAGSGNNSNWNAIIVGTWKSTSGETFNLWKYVRPAGLAKGSIDKNSNTYVPLASSGSSYDLSEISQAPIAGLKGNYIICTNSISGSLVKQLDTVMDDGNTATGSMMASNSIGGAGIGTNSIVNTSTYMVCMGVKLTPT